MSSPTKQLVSIQGLLKKYLATSSYERVKPYLVNVDNKGTELEDELASVRTKILSGLDQKKLGAVFTPKWLADKVTQTAWQHWNKLHRTGRIVKSVADVSCGTGVFLSSARDYFGKEVSLYGCDIDETSIEFAKTLNEAYGLNARLECIDPLINLQKDSLFSSEQKNNKFDVLIGNPPYIRSQNLSSKYIQALRSKYSDIISGNFDLSILFIEHALRSLSEGGIASYITTSKFMHSSYGKEICERLRTNSRILNIVDFKDAQLFPDHTTYVSVITFANLSPAKKFTVTHYPNKISSSTDLRKPQTFSLNTSILDKFPWNLATDQAQSIINKLNSPELIPINHLFPSILQGLRTGKNDVFVLKNDSSEGFEKKYLRTFASGEEIRSLQIHRNRFQLMYPYETESSGDIALVNETRLEQDAPNIYQYLLSKKESLVDRDLDKNGAWYAFSRVQNLHLPQTKKILVKEMMPSSQFAADIQGDVAIASGYALINRAMDDDDLKLWSAVLSTPVMEFTIRQNGTQLHSGWFRLLKHHLEAVRLPRLDNNELHRARKIVNELYKNPSSEQAWNTLDDEIASAFKLTINEHEFIKEYLSNLHKRSLPVRKQNNLSLKNGREVHKVRKDSFTPFEIKKYQKLQEDKPELRRAVTFQINKKLPVHKWFPFTQGYSEPLVDFLIDYLGVSSKKNVTILDPFVGSGTTVLTSKKRGISTVSLDISPLMTWVSKTKLSSLEIRDQRDINDFLSNLKTRGDRESKVDIFPQFLGKAFSPRIWEQIVQIKRAIDVSKLSLTVKDFLALGLVSILEEVSQIRKHGSHYRYMLNPDSIGLQKLNIKIVNPETNIVPIFVNKIREMLKDIDSFNKEIKFKKTSHKILLADSKNIQLARGSIDFVITSPPYLNRNNYISQQKAELALLSLIKDQEQYKKLVRSTFRSHTDSNLDIDIKETLPEVQKIIASMVLSEGNNNKIPQMIAGYFIDLKETLENLFGAMKSKGKVAFVVGNSRWGGAVVPVDHLLLLLAETVGFQAEKIFVTRMKGNSPQQMRQFGKIPVRESIVIFRKP